MKKVIVMSSLLILVTGCQATNTKKVDAGDYDWYTQSSFTEHRDSTTSVGSEGELVELPMHFREPISVSYEPGHIGSQAAERRALLDVLAHIEHTESLIRQAQTQQNPDQRIKFRYDWLRDDLHKVGRGIRDHLNNPQSQPRVVEPLIGDYRR